jgi:hypothetical protein
MIDELELVKQARPYASPPSAGVRAAARQSLEQSIAAPPRRSRRYPRALARAEVLVPAIALMVVIAVSAVFLRIGGHRPGGPATAGGLTLVFAAESTTGAHSVGSAGMQRTVRLERQRLASVLPGARVSAAGDQLLVGTGGRARVRLDELLPLVQDPGQLLFYDWEASTLTPSGRAVAARLDARDPAAIEISQGGSSGAPGGPGSGSLSLYAAVRLAARQPRWVSSTNSRRGAEYFMFAKPGSSACAAAARYYKPAPSGGPCYVAGPEGTRMALALALPPRVDQSSAGIETLTVRQGWTVLQAAQSTFNQPLRWGDPAAQYYVLRDDVSLFGSNVTGAHQSTDASGAADVAFGMTSRGLRRFQAVTAGIARRGAAVSRIGETLNQHFAAALDTQLMTVPSIDFKAYPAGIDAARGADLSAGFTAQSARRLAAELRMGALPVHLTLVAIETN